MRVTLYPFFSQQNKITNKFRLDSDSGVKLYAYIAKQLVALGHEVQFVLPPCEQREGAVRLSCAELVSPALEVSNLDRRLQWDPAWLRRAGQCDLLLTQHEFLAYPLRCLYPQLRIVMECGIRPDTAWPETKDMFPLAWRAATLVHCNSQNLADAVTDGGGRAVVWSFAYDDRLAVPRHSNRDVDVLFNARCSATEYSNHSAFVSAMKGTELRVQMTDPTNYLRQRGEVLEWTGDPVEHYEELLHRVKVVVGLTDNGYGGYAFREAVAAGACPVALRSPSYTELLTDEWPYLCELSTVRSTVESAVKTGWKSIGTKLVQQVSENLRKSSYSAAWRKAKEDLCL